MSAYDELYEELGAARGLGHMSSGWTRVAAALDALVAEARAEALNEAADMVDPGTSCHCGVDRKLREKAAELRRKAGGGAS